MEIRYLGHSAFEITAQNKKILIDPFLVCYPSYKPDGVTDIFVTHGHGDHLGSAIDISKSTGAKITAVFELANYCASKGANVNSMGLGAWKDFSWGRAILVNAFHSSSTPEGIYAGSPCGVILEIEGNKIYHSGDTSLNAEMKLIGELYSPLISMLPIGGTYTMDIEHTIIASKWLQTKYVIPMHYNTFEAITVDLNKFKDGIRKIGIKPIVPNIGEFANLNV